MSSGTIAHLPVPEQRVLVDALLLGPIDNGDGTVTCPVPACSRAFDPKRYNVHRWGSHVRYLDRVHALMLPGMVGCDQCAETLLATSLAKHVSTVHAVSNGGDVHVPRRPGRPRKGSASTSVERAPINGRRVPPVEMPTATDAGLAILAGLAPGGSIPVDELHDVVEWLAATERIVGIARRGAAP